MYCMTTNMSETLAITRMFCRLPLELSFDVTNSSSCFIAVFLVYREGTANEASSFRPSILRCSN